MGRKEFVPDVASHAAWHLDWGSEKMVRATLRVARVLKIAESQKGKKTKGKVSDGQSENCYLVLEKRKP